jgi:hypothetical protein
VIGFDNWEVLGTNARPPLTSIDMNLKELGRVAAQALFEALDGSPRSGVEALPLPGHHPQLDRPAGVATRVPPWPAETRFGSLLV